MSNFNFWESYPELDNNIFLVSNDRTWTYTQLFNEADLIFKNQDRDILLLLASKDSETVTAYIGAIRNGIVPFFVDSDIREEALKRIIDAYRPRYIFHKNSYLTHFHEEVIEEILVSKESKISILNYKTKDIHPKLGALLLTSGSTGDPKSVRISLSNFSVVTDSIVKYLGTTSSSRSVSLLPFHYSYGLSVLHNTMFSRGSIYLTNRSIFDKELINEMINNKVTDISGVPFIFEIFSRMKLDELFSQLECVTQAGGRLSIKYTRKMISLANQFNFKYFTMYGQTEASPRISYVPFEQATNKLGSVGKPISCGSVRINPIDISVPTRGELIYTGKNVCLGYASSFQDLSKDDEFMGEIKTGDIVEIDDDGYISIIGRSKRFIKLKGVSVNLDHVEDIIKSNEIDAAVVGKDDNLVIVVNDFSKNHQYLTKVLKQNFNFHHSLVSFKEDNIEYLSSGKPDYVSLSSKYL